MMYALTYSGKTNAEDDFPWLKNNGIFIKYTVRGQNTLNRPWCTSTC